MTWFFAQVSAVLFILSVPSAFVAVLISCSGPVAAQEFQDCDDCPTMVVIPAGTFMMGSPEDEEGREDDEGPQHEVTIAKPFAVGKFEVTFDEWDTCVSGGGCNGYRPDDIGWGRGKLPVIFVSWDDAQAYVSWLSAKTGKNYKLLSDAEWEYAARAGTTNSRYWESSGDNGCTYANSADLVAKEAFLWQKNVANCRDGSVYTAVVGSYSPNAFGLYDMLGNVWEWTEDCWNESYGSAPSGGSAWTTGDCSSRVLRGESWYGSPQYLRSAKRTGISTTFRNYTMGFRVSRTLD